MALSMRVLSHFQALSFSITVLLSFCHAGTNDSSRDDRASIERLIFFGDSFTDQSRSHSISNESYPRKGYQEVYPPADSGINGGISWPWYLSLYMGLPFDNYACGGAACSNSLTPFGPPDVSSGQLAWFIEDHVLSNATSSSSSSTLDISESSTLAIIWIGTNDLGIHSLVAPDTYTAHYAPAIPPLAPGQDSATTLTDLADCQLNAIRKLNEQYGVQNFLLLSTIPLHLTRLYAPLDAGTIYWPTTHDGQSWNRMIYHLSTALNGFLRAGVTSLRAELPSATSIDFFDTYAFFEEFYLHPSRYFNGTLPANVTGHCHQCPVASDYHYCGIGDCQGAERDSFMWWDELHPSEQTGRLLAAEVKRKMEGTSRY